MILTIDIDDLLVQEWLDYAGYHVRDARDPLEDVRAYMIDAMNEQVSSMGVRGGTEYEELSTKYMSWKIMHGGFPVPDLYLTGDMQRDVRDIKNWKITKKYLHFEPKDPKAEWHQLGTERLPARPILDPIPEDYEYINSVFQEWLDELRVANRRRPSADFRDMPGPTMNILGIE